MDWEALAKNFGLPGLILGALSFRLIIGCSSSVPHASTVTLPTSEPAYFTGRIYYSLWGAGDVGLDTCDSPTIKPATHCGGNRRLEFDGCAWTCLRILDKDARQ